LSGALAVTALQCYLLLLTWSPALATAVLVLGLLAAVGLFLSAAAPPALVVPVAVVAALLGPGAYSMATAATPHSGAIPSAGPASSRGGGLVVFGGGNRGMGGLLSAPTPGAQLVDLLRDNSGRYKWAAATVGSNNAAGYQLGSGVPVMAVGGFNGTDPSPTLEEFQEKVHKGQIHYFLGGSFMPAETGSDASERIAEWVEATFQATTVDGVTVYDLTAEAQG
jgi:hypothetical protein